MILFSFCGLSLLLYDPQCLQKFSNILDDTRGNSKENAPNGSKLTKK